MNSTTPMPASGFRFFLVLVAIGVLFVARTLGDLPATVATNFAGGGEPHAWIGRQAYAGYLVVIGLVIPLAIVSVMARRGGVQAGRWWLASLMLGLALGLHAVLLAAHRTQPPQLSTAGFLTLMGLFVVGLVSWLLRWGRPARSASEVER